MEWPVPKGPLAARWHGCEIGTVRAGAFGTAVVDIENAGTATWRAEPGLHGIQIAYHWLDELGNPIEWDGWWTRLPRAVEPGARVRVTARVQGPLPPGKYRLAFDLVVEGRFWFAEVGNIPLELPVAVEPRIERALAARGGEPDALAAQEEPLVAEERAAAIAFHAAGVAPAPDWSRRVLDAHQEGYAVVGGAIEPAGRLVARPRRTLEPWAPGRGRVPRFTHPLLCPSVVRGVAGEWVEPVEGLPALRPPDDEPSLYDGRIVLRISRR